MKTIKLLLFSVVVICAFYSCTYPTTVPPKYQGIWTGNYQIYYVGKIYEGTIELYLYPDWTYNAYLSGIAFTDGTVLNESTFSGSINVSKKTGTVSTGTFQLPEFMGHIVYGMAYPTSGTSTLNMSASSSDFMHCTGNGIITLKYNQSIYLYFNSNKQ